MMTNPNYKIQIANHKETGHALVILLFFMILSVTVIAASVSLMIITSSGTTKFTTGNQTKTIAEAGIENALVRLLRDPNYTGEQDLIIGNGSVDITVTGSTTKTITAESTLDNRIRKIEVIAQISNNVLSITSWKEIL